MSPQRNGQDLLALQQPLRHFRLHVAEERVQGREAVVLGTDRRLPIRSQMIEKCLYQRRIDLIQRQSFQHEAALVATEPEQQGEDIAVGLDGVCAQVALDLEVLDEEVDGVQGPGFRAPQRDGSFRVAGGQTYEPFFDASKNPEGIFRGKVDEGRVELRDRNGVAYRYYRWMPGNLDGEVEEADDLNIPELLGSAEDNPELRSAKFAIVAAGPNGVFGEEKTEEDDLWIRQGLSAGDPRAETLGRQDNIVEVGR